MNFRFKLITIQMNKQATTCHDCHGLKGDFFFKSNFDLFCLWSNALFYSLDCDYTKITL